MFDIIDAPQRSEAWHRARLGRVTGSRASDVMASIKTGEAAARRDYRLELVTERLTGRFNEDVYVTPEMQRGTDLESDARGLYEALTGQLVDTSGFLAHREILAGCSLDGHVGDFEGIIEIKAPKSATHLANLRANGVRAQYLPQITHNLWISGAAWCDFISFDPRFPAAMQMHIVRVPRNDLAIADYSAKVRNFLDEVETETASLHGWRIQESAHAI